MSHMTPVKWKPSDMTTLEGVARELGFVIDHECDHAVFYMGKCHPCDAVLRVPGCAHEAALTKQGNSWKVEIDAWGTEGAKCKSAMGRLYEAYAERKITTVARRRGWRISKTTNEQGKPRLQLRRG